jgi:hypothetical protein
MDEPHTNQVFSLNQASSLQVGSADEVALSGRVLVPSCGSRKEDRNRQPAASSTLSGLETIQSGPDHVAKPTIQRICIKGALGSALGPIRMVLSKPFDFFMQKAWLSALALCLRDPQVDANWLKPIPNPPVSTLLPQGSLQSWFGFAWTSFHQVVGLFEMKSLLCASCRLHANALGGPSEPRNSLFSAVCDPVPSL